MPSILPPRRATPRIAPTLVVVGTLAALPGAPLAAPDPDALLSFDQQHPMLAGVEDRPMVEVFPDGRVTVFRDALRRNPGEHTFALEDAALERLLQLAGLGLSTAAAAPDETLEADLAKPVAGTIVSAIGDPTASLIGVAATLRPGTIVPPPAPGDDVSIVASSNEAAGFVTLVVRQTPGPAGPDGPDTGADPLFDVSAVVDAPGAAPPPPGTEVSLSADEGSPGALAVTADPLRALELALIELYLLPDVVAGTNR